MYELRIDGRAIKIYAMQRRRCRACARSRGLMPTRKSKSWTCGRGALLKWPFRLNGATRSPPGYAEARWPALLSLVPRM
jgi:hypothetical protein